MGLAEINATIQNMTTPDSIIRGMDTTGYFWEIFIYGLMIVMIVALGKSENYKRISKRIALGTFLPFVLATGLFSVDLVTFTTFFRVLIFMVLGIVYLYVDDVYLSKRG